MMKKLMLFLLTLLCTAALGDVITMQDGRTVENATVMKIGTDEIEYRIGGREVLYSVKKLDVAKITYADGTEEFFNTPAEPASAQELSPDDSANMAVADKVDDPDSISQQPESPAPVGTPLASAYATPKEPPKASVYVTGVNSMIGGTLIKAINTALMKTEIYAGMESIDKHVSGTPSDAQLISAGRQAGVDYVFAVNVSGQISVRIIDVNLATTLAQISLDGQITAVNAGAIAKKIVDFILKEGPQADPEMIAANKATGGGKGGTKREPTMEELAKREQAKREAAEKRAASNYTLGLRQIAGHGFYGLEPYLRLKQSDKKRTYLGAGLAFVNGDRYGNFKNGKGTECQITGFMEWYHGMSVSVNVYGGPGAVAGYYSYERWGIGASGLGLDIGAQGGVELWFEKIVLSADLRAMYYMRFWDKDFDGGITLPIGINVGFAF